MGVVNLSQLNACVLDAKLARTTPAPEPADPTDWNVMFAAVSAAQHHLPLVYRRQFAQPFLDTLGALTEADRVSLQAWPCCADVLRPLYDAAATPPKERTPRRRPAVSRTGIHGNTGCSDR